MSPVRFRLWPMPTIKDIGEWELIRRLSLKFAPDYTEGVTGIGDDCAVIPKDETTATLLSTDLLVEGRHFVLDQTPPEDLGHKALAVNLSDIAAMGGTPHYVLIGGACPPTLTTEWIEAFFAGFHKLANEHNVQVLGGDTTASSDGLCLSITVIGEMPRPEVRLRSMAQPCDIVAVTGTLGDAGAGLESLLEGKDHPELIVRHRRPTPRVKEGQWLATQPAVHSMMDLSDGLASDLARLCEASQCGVCIETDRLPISAALDKYSDDPLRLALSGGEDYGLLLTIDPTSYDAVCEGFTREFGEGLHAIGTIVSLQEGVIYLRDGEPLKESPEPFKHF